MSLMDGVWRLIGVHDDEQEDIIEMEHPARKRQASAASAEGDAELIELPEPETTAVFVVKPARNEKGESQYSLSAYVNFLKSRQALILDVNELARIDLEEAKRVVDFLAGAVRMAEGEAFEITTNVFIFAPYNIKLAGDPLRRVEVS